jgi:hypothetical protein
MFQNVALLVVILEYFSIIKSLALLFAYIFKRLKGIVLRSSLSMVYRNIVVFLLR